MWHTFLCAQSPQKTAVGRRSPLLHDLQELLGLDRFTDVIIHPSFQAALAIADHGIGSHRNDRNVLPVLASRSRIAPVAR